MTQLLLHPTFSTNTWLYATPASTKINISCAGNTTEYELKNTGIVHLDPKCILQTNNITVQALTDKKMNVAKASISYASPTERSHTEFEMPVVKNNHVYAPDDIQDDIMHLHHRGRRHSTTLSISTMVILGGAMFVVYRFVIGPRLAILRAPKARNPNNQI